MTPYHQSPWMRITLAQAAARRRAEVLIEGYIGYDWEKVAKGQRQNKADELRAELKALAALDVDEIDVRINSAGGSVAHGIAIHDLLAAAKADVVTTVEGMTASSATVIAQAGKNRRMSTNALYLVHRVSLGAWGNVHDMELGAKDARAMDERLAGIYAKRSGRKPEDMLALMDRANGRGEWLSAEQAQEAGLIDEAMEPREMAAAVDAATLEALDLPPVPVGYIGRFRPRPAAPTEQTAPPVESAAGVAANEQQPPSPKGQDPMKLTAAQARTLQERFGAEFALAAVTEDMEYAVALEKGSEAQAKAAADARAQLAVVTQERDAAKAEAKAAADQLAKAKAGLADPLAPSDPPAPPADPKAAEAKAKAEAEAKADAEKLANLVQAASTGR